MFPERLSNFNIYETKQKIYIIGSKHQETIFKVLKLDKSSSDQWNTTLDHTDYSAHEIQSLLQMIQEGNKSQGGLKQVISNCFGIVGFVNFGIFYLYVITKASIVASIGGHDIYQIGQVKLIPVAINLNISSASSDIQTVKKSEEELRKIDLFSSVDLSENCYFSYTYDLTWSLQLNSKAANFRDMFMWNYGLVYNGFEKVNDYTNSFILPIVFGYCEQNCVNPFVKLSLIARRSRHFAGVRYLRRGVDDQGRVANEVEIEQILSDQQSTSSYVQLRGSIPLYWSQDANSIFPKPPINIHFTDPYYQSTGLHFKSLMKQYGHGIIVLNLVKQNDPKRETKLLNAYTNSINYLNLFLPPNSQIQNVQFDLSRANKQSRSRKNSSSSVEEGSQQMSPQKTDVITILEKIVSDNVRKLGMFMESKKKSQVQQQAGLIRTNCIDCLDRTNAAQFIIGKVALGYQLRQLGILNSEYITIDCECAKLLMRMYNEMGNVIALQYGGSALVNTMETYRRRPQQFKANQKDDDEIEVGGLGSFLNYRLHSYLYQSRDMIETIKRYYSNSFTDAEKQEAINLFLSNQNEIKNYVSIKQKGINPVEWYTSDITDIYSAQFNATFDQESIESKSELISFTDLLEFKLQEKASQEGRNGSSSPFIDSNQVIQFQKQRARSLPIIRPIRIQSFSQSIIYSNPDDVNIKQLTNQEINYYKSYLNKFNTDKFEQEPEDLKQYNYDFYQQYIKQSVKEVGDDDMKVFVEHVNYLNLLKQQQI